MRDTDYELIYAKKGPAYKNPLPLPNMQKPIGERGKVSYYLYPIDNSIGRPAGFSRRAGHASHQIQKKAIDAIISSGKKHGLTTREIAHVLAIAYVESGFNPDAAAGTTTGTGLGQFVEGTGKFYGINDSTRFDVDTNADALVRHYIDNKSLAIKRGASGSDLYEKIYQYHHDGPGVKNNNSEGIRISRERVLPLRNKFEAVLEGRNGKPEVCSTKTTAERRVQTPETDDYYLVKQGDTLSRIVRINNISIAEIVAANPSITDINRISVGQKLILPRRKASAPSHTSRTTRSTTARKPRIGEQPKQSWSVNTLLGWFKQHK
ncbi:phage tail tip lysozyme [Geobacter sp.]|uniref:LysM peptidoglycan-binding domain-containing protein n=1 Tax=Geobacter sp. TaxID=46610 RepID=UPI0026279086|nr:phage tail tip lysozyme [Geobacter sp.]